MHLSRLSALPLCLFGAVVLVTSCSSGTTPSGNDGGADSGGPAQLTPSSACSDTIDSVYADPGTLPADKGAIIKCATDKAIAKADLQTQANADGYKGKAFTSGAKVYRVLYRTERGDAKNTAGYSSAIVYVPDTPRADGLPVVVASHGSRGQAARCAPSKQDPSTDTNTDFRRQVFPLVGLGYAVIAPDLAGYANWGAANNPPPVYASTADVGKSTLDGARALKKLFPALSDKTVIVGHSQGGHTALSALALASTYGTSGTVVGVATYAPLWLSQRSWGAVAFASIGKNYPINTNVPAGVALWYLYTHAEMLDGPGEGKKLFVQGAQAPVEAFVKNKCWGEAPYPYKDFDAVGTVASDLFDQGFGGSVGLAAAITGNCNGDATCDKWMARFAEDRPHLTGAAQKTPLLMVYGLADDTIPPNRITCAIDRLKTDGANMTVCGVPGEGHGSVLGAKGDYVSDWIASLTLGAAAPAKCEKDETAIVDPMTMMPATCASPPPND